MPTVSWYKTKHVAIRIYKDEDKQCDLRHAGCAGCYGLSETAKDFDNGAGSSINRDTNNHSPKCSIISDIRSSIFLDATFFNVIGIGSVGGNRSATRRIDCRDRNVDILRWQSQRRNVFLHYLYTTIRDIRHSILRISMALCDALRRMSRSDCEWEIDHRYGQFPIFNFIVDQCPECDPGHLDLFENAFKTLSPSSSNPLSTSYKFVDCPISSSLVLHNKSGTSAYWFSMQVVNANEPVSKLEVSTDGGSTWKSTTRQEYNFFENSSGFGTATVTVRVTGESGSTVVVKNVSVASDSQVTAVSNL
ncbi:hypothetical protein E0Z10_g736 [Xylaria hypoxylon]|uniref:Expansin-like EG45 domain-containing protein n=1 Tax=Xylaria hypoxylon TaxID=37992 RepID=A0A4Z0Z881_9PEZI|nr:hypothetical protein E0Z10_g736 [Xylaria hypoxylon]